MILVPAEKYGEREEAGPVAPSGWQLIASGARAQAGPRSSHSPAGEGRVLRRPYLPTAQSDKEAPKRAQIQPVSPGLLSWAFLHAGWVITSILNWNLQMIIIPLEASIYLRMALQTGIIKAFHRTPGLTPRKPTWLTASEDGFQHQA